MRNWNYCNPWNGFQSYPATNSPNAVNAKTTTARILVVDAPPSPTVASKTICFGGNRTLTVTSPAVGTIKWYSNSTLTTWLADGASYTPPQTAVGSYPFWVVDRSNTGLNCQSPATPVTLTINPIPNKPGITASGPLSFCFAGANSVTLTAVPNSPPAVSSYQWYKDGTAVGGATSDAITLSLPSDNGTYTVRTFGIPSSSCPSPLSDPVTVTVYSLTNITHPVDQTICELGTTTFTATSTDAIQKWQWEVSDDGGLTWGNTNNGTYYNGFNSNSLIVLNTPLSFNNNRYRVQITTTAGGCIFYSNPATLTVNALPVPTLAGPASVCAGTTGNVYTTEGGMTNYVWSVSAGGTVTAGGTATSNTVTVTWNTAGARTVSVNYKNAGGCTAVNPTVKNVTVNALPVPTITGPAPACVGTTGNIYSTESGMTNYTWTVSAGGSITAGGGATDNSVTVTWNSTGARSVRVNYTDINGCTASSATVKNVTVNSLPAPTIAGPSPVCAGTTGNVYTTQNGMTNYIWTVSAGGSITAGGGTANRTVTVTWNTAGAQTVSVNYTNANGCTAASATVKNVTVNALPAPVIAGPSSICAGTTGNVYSTAGGMTNYVWSVSAGGTITAGGGTGNSTVTVTWNTAGAQTVSVNYNNAAGCPAASPTVYGVTVNALPLPTITGPAAVCIGSSGNVYTTESGMTNYVWNVSAGGTVTAGGTNASRTVTVTWTTAGAKTVSVNYTNTNGCTALSPVIYNVAVGTSPSSAVLTLSGDACSGAGISNMSLAITGGAPPYNIKYTKNGSAQTDIAGYTTGSNISLGALAVGSYIYKITEIKDNCGTIMPAAGLPAQQTLTIYPIPNAAATVNNTPNICNNGTTDIVLHSTVASSDFIVTVAYAPAVTWQAGKAPSGSTIANGEGVSISQNLAHDGTSPVTVTYSIQPRGPGATACLGAIVTRSVIVQPSLVVTASGATICSGTPTNIDVNTVFTGTYGVKYNWIVSAPVGISGSSNGPAGGATFASNIYRL